MNRKCCDLDARKQPGGLTERRSFGRLDERCCYDLDVRNQPGGLTESSRG